MVDYLLIDLHQILDDVEGAEHCSGIIVLPIVEGTHALHQELQCVCIQHGCDKLFRLLILHNTC